MRAIISYSKFIFVTHGLIKAKSNKKYAATGGRTEFKMKKSTKRFLSLISMILVLSTVLGAFAACNKDTEGGEETTGEEITTGTDTPNTPSDATTIDYTVEVVSAGGLAMQGVKFDVYAGNEIKGYGEIGEDGKATVKLPAGASYSIVLSNVPDGYDVKDSYTFTGVSAKIILTSAVIDDEDLSGVTYKLGDVMHDFAVTTTDGTEFRLSEALEDKKCVLINFFYTTCSPCVSEFPYINAVAGRYTEDVAVIAINPTSMPGETEEAVKNFKEQYELSIPMAKANGDLASAFGVTGYPTSVFVDRYGVICLIEIGGLPSETPFTRAFDYFTHPQYVQKLFNSIEELTPIEKPDVEMPSSDEIKNAIVQGNMNVTFHPEENEQDKEFAWPFIIDPEDPNAIMSSNSFKDGSFAVMYADIELKAGEALAIDYFTQTEGGADILFVLVNGRDIYQISGVSEDWETCYPYVALEDGTYEVAITYLKDSSTNLGNDIVKIKNMRIVNKENVDRETFIPRYAATNKAEDGMGFENYATVVYNENDGYYHVHDANGPLLLANLMSSTPFSDESINDMGYGLTGTDGKFVHNGVNIYTTPLEGRMYNLTNYANFSINGYLYGYVPVTEELREMLEICVQIAGKEKNNPNQWLQVCSYYDAYGTDKQLDNPIMGLANFSAYEAIETTDPNNIIKNTFTYTHAVMPRGYRSKFTPTKSGVYLIRSYGTEQLHGWIFTDASPLDPVYQYEFVERIYKVDEDTYKTDLNNVYMVVYLTEGKDYYINIALLDPTLVGTVEYSVEYVAETEVLFRAASPGPFTYSESSVGGMSELVAAGVSAKLGDDGFYYAVNKDGSLGSKFYADFVNTTEIFSSQSILQLIDIGAFDFRLDEIDTEVVRTMKKYTDADGNIDRDACINAIKSYYSDNYELIEGQVLEALAGKYHGAGDDYTERMREIVAEKLIDEDNETKGCVIIDEELANILQLLMDKYTFKNVETSWRKFCFYYQSIDATEAL